MTKQRSHSGRVGVSLDLSNSMEDTILMVS